MVISVPSEITQVEERAVVDAATAVRSKYPADLRKAVEYGL
jgi:actin-like ATPase involved in cell morphogenesis